MYTAENVKSLAMTGDSATILREESYFSLLNDLKELTLQV